MTWHSGELRIVSWQEKGMWSTADAAWLLDIPVRTVRDALRRAGVDAAGKRYDHGRSTRYVRVYPSDEVLRVLGCDDLKKF
jgi:hypothetical protein